MGNDSLRVILLSAGTPHRPNFVHSRGWPVAESTSQALYLNEVHGMPFECMIRETTSLDTIGNAYFLRTQIVGPLRLRRFLVITSEFHMPRTRTIFNWMFQTPSPTAAHRRSDDDSVGNLVAQRDCGSGLFSIDFESASDTGIDPAVLRQRQEREAQSLESFATHVAPRFPCDQPSEEFLHQVASWLFASHRAYSCHSDMVPQTNVAGLSAELLESY